MEKECIQEISNKLTDVPFGKCLTIRHSSGKETAFSECSGQELPADARLKIITYELYPGIEISYNYFQAERFPFHHCHRSSALAVDHCCRGRIGWEMSDGLSLYLGSGDLSFHMNTGCGDSVITLPLGYYEGLSLTLDIDILEDHSPELIEEAALAIRLEATLDELTDTIHCHPTVAEALREAALAAQKRAIHIPNKK